MRQLLIVEDDTIYAAPLAGSMRARGYTVGVAGDIAVAHSKMTELVQEFMILDLNLKRRERGRADPWRSEYQPRSKDLSNHLIRQPSDRGPSHQARCH